MPREIIVDWTTVNGGGKVSVFYFPEAADPGDQRLALSDFLSGIDGVLAYNTDWSIRGEGREFDAADGVLTGAWQESTVRTGSGASVNTQPAPDAVQILCRWHTTSIVDGRFVAGRTFLPGVDRGDSIDGNLSPGAISGIQTEIDAYLGSGYPHLIWSRPRKATGILPARPGSIALINSGSVWNEFAVLRRRRG